MTRRRAIIRLGALSGASFIQNINHANDFEKKTAVKSNKIQNRDAALGSAISHLAEYRG
jgi:hypothetical protein